MKLIIFLIMNPPRQQAKLRTIFNAYKKVGVYGGSIYVKSTNTEQNFYKKALIYETDKLVYIIPIPYPQIPMSRLGRYLKNAKTV